MCDLPEEELAEYLLWREYADARVKDGAKPLPSRASRGVSGPGESIPEPVPA